MWSSARRPNVWPNPSDIRELSGILWHNDVTNEIQIWFMDGHKVIARATVLGEDGSPAFVGPPFNIVGVGEFGGREGGDIVWHNSVTHETQLWFMNGHRLVGRATVLGLEGNPVFIGPPFSIVGVGDFGGGTGGADIVWHNSQTNETQLWFMDGAQLIGRGTVIGLDGNPLFVGSPWRIVGATGSKAGALTPAQRATISLDRLHCHKSGEITDAEPYLLTAFFKIDGDTNFINLKVVPAEPANVIEAFIDGPCTFQGTPGAHGNLHDTSVNDGDDVPIPPALGQFEFDVKPITAAELGQPDLGLAGFVGIVVALFEENSLTDDAAESAHAAFNRTLQNQINTILPTLRQNTHERPTRAELEQLQSEVGRRVKAAIKGTEIRKIFGTLHLLNPDVLIGAAFFITDKSTDIHARLQRIRTVVFPPGQAQQIVTHDYELFGSIAIGVPPM